MDQGTATVLSAALAAAATVAVAFLTNYYADRRSRRDDEYRRDKDNLDKEHSHD